MSLAGRPHKRPGPSNRHPTKQRTRRALLEVTREVIGSKQQSLGILCELTEPTVATEAQQPTNLTRVVVVIHVQGRTFAWWSAADPTASALRGEYGFVFGRADTEGTAQVSIPISQGDDAAAPGVALQHVARRWLPATPGREQ
jgi:hypothetical protein